MANAVEMSTMRKLVAQLNRYRHEYYNLNAPSVADDVYDYMYDELLALEEHTGVCMANSPTQTVGYAPYRVPACTTCLSLKGLN